MINLTRREVLAGTSAVAISLRLPPAEAWIHGSVTANLNRVSLNVNPAANTQAYTNMAQSLGFKIPFANSPNASGYPTVVTASDIACNPVLLIGYFGDYVLSWTGTTSFNIHEAGLVRQTNAAGVCGGIPGTSGDSSSITILNKGGGVRVQFTPGAFIQAIAQGASNGAGGNYIRLTFKTGYVSNFSGTDQAITRIIKVQNSAQNSTNVQDPNAIGTWNYNVVDASNIDLTTNTATGAVSAWTANFAIPGGEALTTPSNLHVQIIGGANGATSYSFSNLVLCTTANESLVATQYWDPTFVSDLQYMCNAGNSPLSNRAILRFMDFSQVQGSFEADFAGRLQPGYLGTDNPNYTTTSANAAITNGGASGLFTDAYSCADATTSVWNGTSYIDSACIQGTVATSNAGGRPSLAVGGHPAAPIFDDFADPLFIPFTGAPTAGQTYQLTFTVAGTQTWFNGGGTNVSYTFNYTASAGASCTITSSGTTSATITVVSGTLAANQLLQWSGGSAFIRSQTSGPAGGSGAYVLDRATTLSGVSATVTNDTASASAAGLALAIAFNDDLVLSSSHIVVGWNGNAVEIPFTIPTAQAGALTVTIVSAPAIFTITTLSIGAITTGNAYFQYNAMLGGWIYMGSAGYTRAGPLEFAVQLCNLVGAHCYWNWPSYTQSAYVTGVTQFFADSATGLTQSLRFFTEVANEVWRIGGQQLALTTNLGFFMGFPNGGNATNFSWLGMRTVQCAALSRAAWTGKGRNSSDHYVVMQGQQSDFGAGGNFDVSAMRGTYLVTSNQFYSNYGGWGGTSIGDHSTSPNRPCDIIDASGFADYWWSDYIGQTTANAANNLYGTVSDNSIWLQASKDYALGNTATAFNAMSTMFNTQRGSASIVSATYDGSNLLTVALASTLNQGTLAPGDIIHFYQMTGTGSFSFLTNSGNGWSCQSPSSGTTITIAVGSRPVFSLTGGIIVDETASGLNPAQGGNMAIFKYLYWPLFEGMLAQYDNSAGRSTNGVRAKMANIHYEGAPQWSVSSNLTNGTNDVTSISDLVTAMTNLSWNVDTYDVLAGTGAAAISHVAQQVINLIQGWKRDLAGLSPSNAGTAANTNSYKTMIKNFYAALAATNPAREIKPAQFGIDDNTWALYQGFFPQNIPYASRDAIKEFNAGG